MSVFDTKTNRAICILPWVHEYKSIENGVAPCCQSHRKFKDGEDIEQVRQSMLKGKRHDICTRCYDSEDESGWSFRIHETRDWIKKFGEPNVDEPRIEHIDIRFDPTCNLKCKMCGPHNSTLWQKEKNVKITSSNYNKEYFKEIDKKILKKIYLAGGEPTYIREYLDFLLELNEVNPDCEVMINTNLKKLPENWKYLIKKLDKLTVICSCDAIEELGSYVRYPLGWQEFEENVKYVSENANFLQFNLVANNLTSHKIDRTCGWMQQYSDNINLSVLYSPKVFSEVAIPPEVRRTYLDSIEKIQKFKVSIQYAGRFRSEANDLLKKYKNATYDKTVHEALRREIEEQDSHRTMQLKDVDPFLHSWIFK